MARIRSIKPEFPQSETIGQLSRDARLLFIMLWTIADDSGRARAASRMLASLLYPYDDDAPKLIEAWLRELECAGCIRRYEAGGATYLEIVNWLKHQKIDKPTTSRLPEFREASPTPREDSRTLAPDLGPRTLDQDKDSDPIGSGAVAPVDYRKELFNEGLKKLAALTGKTPNSCRSLVGRWLSQVQDEAIHVLGWIDEAERNRVADPVGWIEKQLQILHGRRGPALQAGFAPRPGSKEDNRERTHHALRKLTDYVDAQANEPGGSSGAREANAGLIPFAKPARP